MAAKSRPADRQSDEVLLHYLGYRQVLHRKMGTFSNFAISFSIISVVAAGCVTTYYQALNNGGPVAIVWGWVLVSVFTTLVAMAMAEIASSMPTAGALYFWASRLGGPAWGWFTGWFNLVGQISVTAGIDYGGGVITTALLNLLFPDLISTDSSTVFIVFTIIITAHVLLNLLNINVLSLLNSIAGWWGMIGVALIVNVLITVPHHQSVSFVFTETLNNSGFSGDGIGFWYVFGLGLLMSAWTITGYDASAHLSEETNNASRSVARGMVLAVVVSGVFGFFLLVALTFAIPDVQGTLDAGVNAIPYILTTALNEQWTAFLLFIVVVGQFFCGTSSVQAASRMMFAFSRDGAVPGSRIWRKVSRNRAPVNSVIAIGALAWLIMVPSLFIAVAYVVATSIAVVGLSIAFGLPILLRIRAGSSFERGAWSLGGHYKWISPLAVGWIVLLCVLFLLPVSPKGVPFAEDFDWELVNYAPFTVGGALLLFGGWYLFSARRWFTGPVRETGSNLSLDQIRYELERGQGGQGGPGGPGGQDTQSWGPPNAGPAVPVPGTGPFGPGRAGPGGPDPRGPVAASGRPPRWR
jgi:amino acid transporter